MTWMSVCLSQSEICRQLIVQFRRISQRSQPFSHTLFHCKQDTIDLLTNAYPKLHTQLPNSWSIIITEATDKPCECLYWHYVACSLMYKSPRIRRACTYMKPLQELHSKPELIGHSQLKTIHFALKRIQYWIHKTVVAMSLIFLVQSVLIIVFKLLL